MKIVNLSIVNFRSFGQYQNPVTGEFNALRTINMIYGENNSGKSNALKFIDLIFSRKISREAPIIVDGERLERDEYLGSFWQGLVIDQPFIFHKNDRTQIISFTFSIELQNTDIENSGLEKYALLIAEFPSARTVSTLEFKGQVKNFGDPYSSLFELVEVKMNGLEIYSEPTGGKKSYFSNGNIHALVGDVTTFENLIGILNDKLLFLDNDRYYSREIEENNTKLTTKNFKNWIYKLSLDSVNYKKYEAFLDFVKAQGFGGVAGKIFKNFNPSFSKKNGEIEIILSNGFDRLPISSLGTGIHQILFVLALIFETKAKIILIEELELNLSPQSQRELLQIFRRLITKGIIDQVIFTTHSPYLRSTTDFSIYQVSMNSVGVSMIEAKSAVRPSFFNYKRH
jgi:predicted ATP-dependent endonuclease of OLD family